MTDTYLQTLIEKCGDHLITSLNAGDFTAIAAFSLTMRDYDNYGAEHFTTMVTVNIMRYVSHLTDKPNEKNMKIVARARQSDDNVIIDFRWLTSKMRSELKKSNPAVVEICWICKQNKPSRDFKKCARCRDASYCSVQCQRRSWPEHRKECRIFPEKK